MELGTFRYHPLSASCLSVNPKRPEKDEMHSVATSQYSSPIQRKQHVASILPMYVVAKLLWYGTAIIFWRFSSTQNKAQC